MKKKKWITLSAVLLFLVIVSVLSIRINSIYPQGEEIIYGVNEDIPYGDDVYIRVNEARFLSEEEKEEIHPDEYQRGVIFESLVASVTVKNIGTEERTPELYPIMVESGVFANGCELFAMWRINENWENQTPLSTLKPGEEVTVLMPFLMAEIRFQSDDWEQVKEREFKLVFNLYPQKKSILLSIDE